MAQDRIDNLFASESWSAVYTAFTNISLKAYDFDNIREALLTYVAQTYPDKFNDYIASSEFIAVLDLVAYLGHSLSFRMDMNSRENFLDTAERRSSILRLAKNLGYQKNRPVNARGFMKISSVMTNQRVYDSDGKSLQSKKILWNDTNNENWYDNFVTVLNAALQYNTKTNSPAASSVVNGVQNNIHYVNESPTAKSVRYSFTGNIAGQTRAFDAVRAEISDDIVTESEPNFLNNFTIISRDDSFGPSSDRTGFFIYAKAGQLKYKDLSYTSKISNRIEQILDTDISNSDIWLQKIDSAGNYYSSVALLDNSTRDTAIYNYLRTGSADLASIRTNDENRVEIVFPDGVYGNTAYGKYRVWYRIVDNADFSVDRGEIKNASIVIPYIGEDDKPYLLTVTMQSTVDFLDNYVGENYYSVKRLAPKTYYTQDRMVNGQDYNILPLSLGSSVVTKVKAVNTTFAGKSRYFEMDDVTGHHSTISVTGTDGSVYIENDPIQMEMFFNLITGDIDSFVRNDLTAAITHPSMVNAYYYTYRYDASVNMTNIPYTVWERDPSDLSNNLKGTFDGFSSITQGDNIRIGEEWYTVVRYVHSTNSITLDRVAPYGEILKERVKAYEKVFVDAVVDAIKYQLSENYLNSFYLVYGFPYPEGGSASWNIITDSDIASFDSELTSLFNTWQMKVFVKYLPGIRTNESRFVVSFTGKRIIFESNDQVKFYYSNGNNAVIDTSTNLAKTDKIIINYAEGEYKETSNVLASSQSYMTVGFGPVVNIDHVNNTFDVSFACAGGPENMNFIENNETYLNVTYTHHIVSPNCDEQLVSSPTNPIGTVENGYTITYPLDILDDTLYTQTEIVSNLDTDDTNDLKISLHNISLYFGTGNVGNVGNTGNVGNVGNVCGNVGNVCNDGVGNVGGGSYYGDIYTVMTSWQLENVLGLHGKITMDYLDTAQNDGHFFFIDEDEMPVGKTLQTIELGDRGTQAPFVSLEANVGGIQTYKFTFMNNQDFKFCVDDCDIFIKQKAYSEVTFVTTVDISASQLSFRTESGKIITSDYFDVISTSNDVYRVVFWTPDVPVQTIVDVLYNNVGDYELYRFHCRVKATFTDIDYTVYRDKTYSNVGSFVYDHYITPEGYVDNKKVKLMSKDLAGNPNGLINVFKDVSNTDHMIIETYTYNNVEYTRASEYAVVLEGDVTFSNGIPPSARLAYDIEADKWYKKTDGLWNILTGTYTIPSTGKLVYSGVTYEMVEGKTYVTDKYMSFRWDHYADKDKRIDPSTSNIVDIYVLSSEYVRKVNQWIAGNFKSQMPSPPTSYELKNIMSKIKDKSAIADHVSYIPVRFKYLFGAYADEQNQAVFKVVKRKGTPYTDSEIKSMVSAKVNEYFAIDNWEFGDTFYFSEVAAYLHKELSEYIASVVITPKFSNYDFTDMLSITSEPYEMFLSVTTSADVKIIDSITKSELSGG